MKIDYYKNKATGDIFKIISKTLVNANKDKKGGMIHILYQDVKTGQLYFKNGKEFDIEFVWKKSTDDCEVEFDDSVEEELDIRLKAKF